ncbi:MAG: hypothetical protein M1818_001331 [Claussenomyces sp. TS43310]|nr:MAG: hypothetical protein M1818_001331 [Claussenomyces sp. TS43310]
MDGMGRLAQPGVRRKAHHKSRHGCQQCKRLKVKCDEAKPKCNRCLRHSTECSLQSLQPDVVSLQTSPSARPNSTSSSPSKVASLQSLDSADQSVIVLTPPPGTDGVQSPAIEDGIPSPPPVITGNVSSPCLQCGPTVGQFDLADMELLCNYINKTCISLRGSDTTQVDVWKNVVPKMAFRYDFLMYGLLAVSAIHLSELHPDMKKHYLSLGHRNQELGLRRFRAAVATVNKETCHACWAFSMLLAISDRPGDMFSLSNNTAGRGFMALLRGGLALLNSFPEEIHQGPLKPLFEQWYARRSDVEWLDEEDSRRFRALSNYWRPLTTRYTQWESTVLECALNSLKEVCGIVTSPGAMDDTTAILSWPAMVTDAFAEMLVGRDRGALAILAHYCVLLKRLEHVWWIRGEAEILLEYVKEVLGREDEAWIRWPIEQVGV